MTKSTSPAHSARKSASPATRRVPATRSSDSEKEAIAQLTEDHARVKRMFKHYDKLAKSDADGSERQALASMICAELTAHATAEEEILYPAAPLLGSSQCCSRIGQCLACHTESPWSVENARQGSVPSRARA